MRSRILVALSGLLVALSGLLVALSGLLVALSDPFFSEKTSTNSYPSFPQGDSTRGSQSPRKRPGKKPYAYRPGFFLLHENSFLHTSTALALIRRSAPGFSKTVHHNARAHFEAALAADDPSTVSRIGHQPFQAGAWMGLANILASKTPVFQQLLQKALDSIRREKALCVIMTQSVQGVHFTKGLWQNSAHMITGPLPLLRELLERLRLYTVLEQTLKQSVGSHRASQFESLSSVITQQSVGTAFEAQQQLVEFVKRGLGLVPVPVDQKIALYSWLKEEENSSRDEEDHLEQHRPPITATPAFRSGGQHDLLPHGKNKISGFGPTPFLAPRDHPDALEGLGV